jgi:hypothetical protein
MMKCLGIFAEDGSESIDFQDLQLKAHRNAKNNMEIVSAYFASEDDAKADEDGPWINAKTLELIDCQLEAHRNCAKDEAEADEDGPWISSKTLELIDCQLEAHRNVDTKVDVQYMKQLKIGDASPCSDASTAQSQNSSFALSDETASSQTAAGKDVASFLYAADEALEAHRHADLNMDVPKFPQLKEAHINADTNMDVANMDKLKFSDASPCSQASTSTSGNSFSSASSETRSFQTAAGEDASSFFFTSFLSPAGGEYMSNFEDEEEFAALFQGIHDFADSLSDCVV